MRQKTNSVGFTMTMRFWKLICMPATDCESDFNGQKCNLQQLYIETLLHQLLKYWSVTKVKSNFMNFSTDQSFLYPPHLLFLFVSVWSDWTSGTDRPSVINAVMLLASSSRLIFGGPVVALGLTGKSLSAVKWELKVMLLWMSSPLLSGGPLLSCGVRLELVIASAC